ncbi:ATP-binding protein [Clostridium sp. CS001]|uniref:AAA family ATPase n=1 Tax=Clostridium sp. CS001 TaxID=2880648 RepID=UPI001CF22C7B|nr:ATP-binding protein [Clostridium sp. CS001]MCB2291587.1 ATP-binding protein [Clostridium sp. CS001]
MQDEINSIYLPNGGIAVKAIYNEQMLDEYNGNPLIEALIPILSKEEVIDELSIYPYFEEKERELDAKYRLHCVQRLFQYFEPLNKHIEIEQRFSRVIRQGYLARNPLAPEYSENLQNGYKAIKSGQYNLNSNNIYRTTAAGFTIIGISGIGKTTTVGRILSMYPQIIVHSKFKEQHLNLYQISWLKLDCPFDGSIKGLCINFFNSVDRLLGTNYYNKFGTGRNSVDTMMPRMSQIASLHCIGVLIIDEIQHLSLAKSGGSDKMLNFFVTLVNTIGIPVILIGTTKALPILQGEFRQARRGSGQGDLVWDRMKNDMSWELLLTGMWELQWTRKHCDLDKEIIDAIYYESQGIIDLAIKVFAMAQLKAIATGKELINIDMIHQVANESLKLVKPMLDALRSGKLHEIDKYKDILPVDIEEFYQEQLSKVDFNKKINEIKERKKDKKQNTTGNLAEEATFKLVQLGIEVSEAKKYVEIVIKDNSNIVDETLIVKEAFKIYVKLENKKATLDKTSKIKNTINNINKKDLRYLVGEGKKQNQIAYVALNSAGYIKDVVEEFIERKTKIDDFFSDSVSG